MTVSHTSPEASEAPVAGQRWTFVGIKNCSFFLWLYLEGYFYFFELIIPWANLLTLIRKLMNKRCRNSRMFELGVGIGCPSWMFELNVRAGCPSWMFELDVPALRSWSLWMNFEPKTFDWKPVWPSRSSAILTLAYPLVLPRRSSQRFAKCSRSSRSSSFLDQVVAQVLSQQVDRPVDHVEHAEHGREADSGHYVDSLWAVRERGEPALDEVAAGRTDSHLTAAQVAISLTRWLVGRSFVRLK